MQILVPTPDNFSFKRTVISHGWAELLPFEFHRENWSLIRVLDTQASTPLTVTIAEGEARIVVEASHRPTKTVRQALLRDVRHMFRLDDDMSPFYDLMSLTPGFEWIEEQGAGRLLRSPTVFEDLVKMICTTNCSWALTEKMVTGLVQTLGQPAKDGRRTFPTPEAMAQMPIKFYVNEVRAGYRAPYLKELADKVAAGAVQVETWLTSSLATADLIKQIKSVKGVGDYAAENLLKLLGRYDGLALDSWTRAKFSKIRNNGRIASDKKIVRYYSRFKEWRGLALWCDVTRDWLDGQKVIGW